MTKPYLVFMCSCHDEENVRELVEPIKPYIRGVCALIHDGNEFDPVTQYLLRVNNELGGGNVIFGKYGRHDHSRNRILYETGMKEGDWYCQADVLERPKPDFFRHFEQYLVKDNPDVDAWYYYGKPFFVKFNEGLRYQGNPHEALIGANRVIELSPYHPDDKVVRENIRPIKRADQPKHFVTHYLRYLLLENSNQNLLGLEHHMNKYPFEKKEAVRKNLVKFLAKNKYPRTAEGVLEAMRRVGANGELKDIINEHKTINDFYRLKVLGDEGIFDSHAEKDWDNMPKF